MDPFGSAAGARVLRRALESASLGVLCQGPDGLVVAANGELRRMFGLGPDVDTSPGAAVRPIVRAVSATYVPEHPAARNALRDYERRVRRVAEIPLRDGRIVRREAVPLAEEDGGHIGFLWSFRDVTESKRTEHDLRRDNDALEALVRQRAQFTANASHELRTPLTAVLSFCELLADPVSGELNRGQREFLAAIARNAETMRTVIARLLHSAGRQVGTEVLEPGEVRVPRLLEDAAADRMPGIDAAGLFLTLDLTEGPPLRGDAHLLARVLTNLLDNAAKYTPRGGDIRVTARPCEGAWEVVVADTGIGVPAEARETIFLHSVRAPNAEAGGYPGSGIGLALSRDIVRLHGGTLTVGDREGAGAVFTLRLPLDGAGTGGAAREEDAADGAVPGGGAPAGGGGPAGEGAA